MKENIPGRCKSASSFSSVTFFSETSSFTCEQDLKISEIILVTFSRRKKVQVGSEQHPLNYNGRLKIPCIRQLHA